MLLQRGSSHALRLELPHFAKTIASFKVTAISWLRWCVLFLQYFGLELLTLFTVEVGHWVTDCHHYAIFRVFTKFCGLVMSLWALQLLFEALEHQHSSLISVDEAQVGPSYAVGKTTSFLDGRTTFRKRLTWRLSLSAIVWLNESVGFH
jgi:putative Ca2+/H+ antiporter (TMEM165/GDT1 family)